MPPPSPPPPWPCPTCRGAARVEWRSRSADGRRGEWNPDPRRGVRRSGRLRAGPCPDPPPRPRRCVDRPRTPRQRFLPRLPRSHRGRCRPGTPPPGRGRCGTRPPPSRRTGAAGSGRSGAPPPPRDARRSAAGTPERGPSTSTSVATGPWDDPARRHSADALPPLRNPGSRPPQTPFPAPPAQWFATRSSESQSPSRLAQEMPLLSLLLPLAGWPGRPPRHPPRPRRAFRCHPPSSRRSHSHPRRPPSSLRRPRRGPRQAR